MFCPKCKAEFREGFYRCSECDTDLVHELPEEPEPEYVEWVELLSTFNNADIALIKSILESENIYYFFKGEYFNAIRHLAQPAILMVDIKDFEKAKELLKDLKLSFRGISIDGDE